MRVVIAPDSFKESTGAVAAAQAIASGVRSVLPDAECELVPMADGGEGTVDALLAVLAGELVTVRVTGPTGQPVQATYGWVPAERLAVVEVAAAVGLDLVPSESRDVLRAGSRGVGELVRDALDRGARRLVVGLGGTATSDGGAGMLQALGARLHDAAGHDVCAGPAGLEDLAGLDATDLDLRLDQVELLVACDVTNPLLGPDGAAVVFGPQKGATADQVPRLDAALVGLAPHLARLAGCQVADVPGAGAAGGLGAALLAVGARLAPGVEVVADAVRLAEVVDRADLVLTGEGRVDAQTLRGKTPFGVAQVARQAGVPVVVLAGQVGPGAEALLDHGVDAVVPIGPGVQALEQALVDAETHLATAAATVVRLVALGARMSLSSPEA